MQIPNSEIKKKKLVGSHDGDDVYEVSTVGGLNLILANRKKGPETLGAGSHPAISRWIAEKNAKSIQWTSLVKSEALPLAAFADKLPQYETLTDRFRANQEGSEK